jgi:hypothetical protein
MRYSQGMATWERYLTDKAKIEGWMSKKRDTEN